MIDWQISIGTISLAILWTSTAIGGVIWLYGRFERLLTRSEYTAEHAVIIRQLNTNSNDIWEIRLSLARNGLNGFKTYTKKERVVRGEEPEETPG